jgi:hypothetical protein
MALCYNLVIDAWLKSPNLNAAMRAAEVLRKLVNATMSIPTRFHLIKSGAFQGSVLEVLPAWRRNY